MQRIVERVRKSERSLAKKKTKAYEARLRSEAWERNQQRVRIVKDNTALVRADRKNRAIDWEAGHLAPRRDVGDKAKTYGALSIYNMQLPDKDPKSRLHKRQWHLRKGDRVVITRGRDQGKIGDIDDIDYNKDAVKVKGLNQVDVYVPQWMRDENGDNRDVVPVDQMISRKDVRLVYPLAHPDTGIPRDAIIERLDLVKRPDGKGNLRLIPGSNTIIPWPKPEPTGGQREDYDDDTLRITVEERTFRPFLIRPPMPLTVIDELRNKYSRFRTRHEYDYTVQKELDDAKVQERKGLIKTMRTPLQELAVLREKQKVEQERELSREQLAKIGEVIAQEQSRAEHAAQGVSA
ncbi:Putative ribosomal protein L24 [Septoria linicola]|uniref:Ribosomal protein L24 n=1 Tax=Septoria linicola TaxID=215465 RepID=A0A9Q9B0J1_9PEZI|nr:Putative ribosomal protein L24 [Septoria linicola]